MDPEQLKILYKNLFSTDDGKKVLEDLEKRFHFQNSTYIPNSDETIYKEGQRSVVVFIKNQLNQTNIKELINV
tara:strand:+ start:152 stop:370 length:219 start_codon:yes stop_codon:yes gene_type:complete